MYTARLKVVPKEISECVVYEVYSLMTPERLGVYSSLRTALTACSDYLNEAHDMNEPNVELNVMQVSIETSCIWYVAER